MAMMYGVLRGHPDRYKREDNASTPHLQIRVLDKTGQPWRVAVNVQSDTGSEVVYWLVDPLLAIPSWPGCPPNPPVSARRPVRPPRAGLRRAPLFEWAAAVAAAVGSDTTDDLQDLLSLYLQQCKNAGGEVFVFGAKFDRNLHKPIDIEFGNTDGLHGIHDIHLNRETPGGTPATTAPCTTAV